MDDEGAAPGSFTILDLQLSKKTPKLSCRLKTILGHSVIKKLAHRYATFLLGQLIIKKLLE